MYVALYFLRTIFAAGLMVAIPALLLGVTNAGSDKEVAALLTVGGLIWIGLSYVLLLWLPARLRGKMLDAARGAAASESMRVDVESVSRLLNRYAGLDCAQGNMLLLDSETGLKRKMPLTQLVSWEIQGTRTLLLKLLFKPHDSDVRAFSLVIPSNQRNDWESALGAAGCSQCS